MMHKIEETTKLPPTEFAHLGEGEVGYVKPMRSEDVGRFFPGAPDIAPGLNLFALVSASGAPILVTDSRAEALANARDNDLETVSLH
jgi:hypothetical protein